MQRIQTRVLYANLTVADLDRLSERLSALMSDDFEIDEILPPERGIVFVMVRHDHQMTKEEIEATFSKLSLGLAVLPPIDRSTYTLSAYSKSRFHYIENDPRFADGWYYDHRMWLGDYEPKEFTRYGPIPLDKLEAYVRENEHLLRHRIEDVMAYLKKERPFHG